GGADMPAKGDRPALPDGAYWALDLVDAPEHMRPAVVRLLHDVVFAPDLATARTVVSYAPELRTVTPAGDMLGAYSAIGGSGKAPSFIEVQAAVEDSRRNRVAMEARVVELRAELETVRAEQAAAKYAVGEVAEARKAADSARNTATRRLAELGASARSVTAEAERLAKSKLGAEQARDRDLGGLTELEERLKYAEESPI